jgi:F-type H+-transporting ATPase subunit epsilon
MMKLTIAKVDEVLFKGEAASLSCTGGEGDITILPHHSALVTPLKRGELKVVDKEGKETIIPVFDGVLEVADNEVIVIL